MMMLSIPIYNDLPVEFIKPLVQIAKEYPNIQIQTYTRDGLISRVRNRMFSDFILNKEATHLITIDDDCVFTLEQFEMLMENLDKDIVVGAVPCKKDNPYWVLRIRKPENRQGNLLELDSIGDFQILSRDAAMKIIAKHNDLSYIENVSGLARWAVFMPMVKDGEYLDETWSYSLRAREAGCTLWWDTRIMLGHNGTKVYRK